MATTYPTNPDGSAVCPHRDLSVCKPCAAADPTLVFVHGVYYHIPDADQRHNLQIMVEESSTDETVPEAEVDMVEGECPAGCGPFVGENAERLTAYIDEHLQSCPSGRAAMLEQAEEQMVRYAR